MAALPHQTPHLQPPFSNQDKMLDAALTGMGPASTAQWHTAAPRGKRLLLPDELAMLPAPGEKLAPLRIKSSGRPSGCRAQSLGARHRLAVGCTLAREGSCGNGMQGVNPRQERYKWVMMHPGNAELQQAGILRSWGV